MTFEASAARVLMWIAGVLTPASKAEWRTAMETEFQALDDGRGSLGWAAGCLGAALGWRLRAEIVFLAALASTIVVTGWITGLIFFAVIDHADLGGFSWLPVFTAAQQISYGLVCFGLALFWPGRAALIGFAVLLTVMGAAMGSFFLSIVFRDGATGPTLSAVGDGLMFLGMEMWSSLLGAALGAVVMTFRRRRSAA